jgi:hypothetical protein
VKSRHSTLDGAIALLRRTCAAEPPLSRLGVLFNHTLTLCENSTASSCTFNFAADERSI